MSAIKQWISLQGLPAMVRRTILVVVGILVLRLRTGLAGNIHYVVGTAVLLISAGMLTGVLRSHGYDDPKDYRLAASLLGLVMGLMLLTRRNGSITFIAIAWGLQGMSSGIV